MRNYFDFAGHGTGYRQEILAGITTFLTMAYIIIVNPAILSTAGIPKGPSMVATILAAAFGTVVMGLYARRPFAIAPYMGENAFVAFTVVGILGYSWQVALGAVFIAGVLFTLLTVFRVRSWLAESLPQSLKYSFAVGIGLFLTFIGLNETGLVRLGVPGAPVSLGDISQPTALLALFGFIAIVLLMIRRVPGAIIIGLLATTFLSFLLKVTPAPGRWVSLPPDPRPILLKLDLAGTLSVSFFPVILTMFVMAFVDTVGTLIGLSARAGLLDDQGNLPEIEKPMLADALSTTVAPLLGTTTTGAYIESAAGIEEGGRTGFTSLVVAFLFLLSLFLAPLLTSVPPHAYGAVLIIIGVFMIRPVTRIDFEDYTELIPAFLTIVLMSFTYNIGVGMTAGIIAYPLLKTLSGRHMEVPRGMWVLAALSISFYIFYPYPK
ncbi:MAG: guanine permease [Deltaproteobacteria bacterium RBG_16_64_85]|nr:MAG: guanine permease [Deltaproteobacteria bacterium RBG_16_64_85]